MSVILSRAMASPRRLADDAVSFAPIKEKLAMNLLRCATLTVADVDAAASRFARWLDYAIVERGTVPADLAAAWGAPVSAGRDYALCQPASGAGVFVRFVAGTRVAGYLPIRTYGWAAIEICVQDVLAVAERMAASPFEVVGPPNRIAGLPTIHPMQVRGPHLETIYFTQILTDAPDSGLPKAQSFIDALFILVLACADMPGTARWLAKTLGLIADDPVSIRYSMISKAFNLPPETRHEIATLRHGHDIFIEVDAYPDAASARPCHAGELPPGVAICTLTHPDLDGIAGPWFSEPVVRDGVLYAGRRVGVLQTPEGALVEVVSA